MTVVGCFDRMTFKIDLNGESDGFGLDEQLSCFAPYCALLRCML